MRLVCPNCVAQYEVADGTIPVTGRDVQCANCNHIWFQDAAFKLSATDMAEDNTQKSSQPVVSETNTDKRDTSVAGAATVFRSHRAAREAENTPLEPQSETDSSPVATGAGGRSLPEVGQDIKDILQSEAAFSSQRRVATADAGPDPVHSPFFKPVSPTAAIDVPVAPTSETTTDPDPHTSAPSFADDNLQPASRSGRKAEDPLSPTTASGLPRAPENRPSRDLTKPSWDDDGAKPDWQIKSLDQEDEAATAPTPLAAPAPPPAAAKPAAPIPFDISAFRQQISDHSAKMPDPDTIRREGALTPLDDTGLIDTSEGEDAVDEVDTALASQFADQILSSDDATDALDDTEDEPPHDMALSGTGDQEDGTPANAETTTETAASEPKDPQVETPSPDITPLDERISPFGRPDKQRSHTPDASTVTAEANSATKHSEQSDTPDEGQPTPELDPTDEALPTPQDKAAPTGIDLSGPTAETDAPVTANIDMMDPDADPDPDTDTDPHPDTGTTDAVDMSEPVATAPEFTPARLSTGRRLPVRDLVSGDGLGSGSVAALATASPAGGAAIGITKTGDETPDGEAQETPDTNSTGDSTPADDTELTDSSVESTDAPDASALADQDDLPLDGTDASAKTPEPTVDDSLDPATPADLPDQAAHDSQVDPTNPTQADDSVPAEAADDPIAEDFSTLLDSDGPDNDLIAPQLHTGTSDAYPTDLDASEADSKEKGTDAVADGREADGDEATETESPKVRGSTQEPAASDAAFGSDSETDNEPNEAKVGRRITDATLDARDDAVGGLEEATGNSLLHPVVDNHTSPASEPLELSSDRPEIDPEATDPVAFVALGAKSTISSEDTNWDADIDGDQDVDTHAASDDATPAFSASSGLTLSDAPAAAERKQALAEINAALISTTTPTSQPDNTAEPQLSPPDLDKPLEAQYSSNQMRQSRKSLVEDRKVLLPDVDELNTSLRMDSREREKHLRANAFEDDGSQDRSKFWLGLVTALVLFGIVWVLYLLGPAIKETMPASAPLVDGFRLGVDRIMALMSGLWDPLISWLETL